ncbi:MAG: hypothetical protein HYU98_06555, partial [Deltaproteobacteria bacterium]|nr:hypothetical protein [Deltaproteobacteria bacterium]
MAELCNVSPKEFNDCYLPVQWLEDANNDGIPNKEELWIHPSLLAINAYRQRLGHAPIDAFEWARTAVRYLQTPEEARIKHPLLTEDIASRKRIVSEFDLNGVPEGPYKTAVTELVKATSFSDLYYNLERNPDYLDLLDQVIATGDVTKIRHFWQNGGPICISSEDKACSSLPEAKFDPNGIWWPDEFTKKDADFLQKKYKWESEALKRKVLTPQSCIVSAKKGEEDSFKYKGKWYKVVSINSFPAVQTVADMMGEHLEKAGAALETEDPDFSYFLSQKAAYIRKGPIFGDLDLDKLWVDTNNRALAVFFGHAESYADRGLPLGMKSFMEGVVVYVDKSQQDIIDAGKSQVKQVDEILWQLWESKGEKFPAAKAHSVVPEVVVASKVVSNGGDANVAKYTPGGFVLRNYDNNESDVPREEQYHKTVFFGDVMARRVENQGLPVAKRAFDEESIKKVEAAA